MLEETISLKIWMIRFLKNLGLLKFSLISGHCVGCHKSEKNNGFMSCLNLPLTPKMKGLAKINCFLIALSLAIKLSILWKILSWEWGQGQPRDHFCQLSKSVILWKFSRVQLFLNPVEKIFLQNLKSDPLLNHFSQRAQASE